MNRRDAWTRQRVWETGLLVLCSVTFVYKLLRGSPGNQWDFRVYYYASSAWAEGVNPYLLGNLPKALDEGFFAYTYPPFTLPLFWPFTLLPLQYAVHVYLAIKLVLLAWIIVIWSRILRVRVTEPLWVLFLLFAYSSTIFADFASGNIVTIEQWILWIALAFLLDRRYAAYVAAIVAASLIKLTPIVLLVMCLWIPDRRKYRYLAAGLAGFVGILLATYLIAPRLMIDFFRHVSSLDERGASNPALLPLVKDASDLMARTYGAVSSPVIQTAIYLVLAGTLLAITWAAARRIDSRADNRLELILYLVLLAFAVTTPRFRIYAYMLVVVPTYYVATHATRLPRAVPMLLLACLTANTWMTRPENAALIAAYSSWFIAFGTWAVWVYELWDRDRLPAGASVAAPRANAAAEG